MNRKITIILLLVFQLGCLNIVAQSSYQEYEKILVDGRKWECTRRMYGMPSGDSSEKKFCIEIAGDTIIGERICKKLSKKYYDDVNEFPYFAAFEQNGIVYNVASDCITPIFSLNHIENENVFHGKVVRVDKVFLNGMMRKRITIDAGEGTGHYQYYIIEGIGISSNAYIGELVNSYYDELDSVYDDGACIFTKKDFTTVTGITVMNNLDYTNSAEDKAYDVNGRIVKSPYARQIIIKNKKKVLLEK